MKLIEFTKINKITIQEFAWGYKVKRIESNPGADKTLFDDRITTKKELDDFLDAAHDFFLSYTIPAFRNEYMNEPPINVFYREK